ncbi:WG repeat-containing protein [Campylobacter sp.]|uniref:WG repeat-containing protein n=1 Tax=Campylobacter sp. TaxID=205 RepID=UPI00270EBB8B|nr:WG repeat-containing protein [Campylobacter sp.]
MGIKKIIMATIASLGLALQAGEKQNIILPFIYEDISFSEEGLISAKKDGKYGVIDISGNEILPFAYDYLSRFKEGLAIVVKIEGKSAKQGFIDKSGKIVVPMEYEPRFTPKNSDAFLFNNGIAKVSKDGKYGFISKAGKVVTPIIYDEAHWIDKNFAKVLEYKDRKAGLIDSSGKLVLPVEYEEHIVTDKSGLFIARKRGEGVAKFLDKNLNVVLEGDYLTAAFHDGLSRVGFHKQGYMDKTGKLVIDKIYDNAADFKNGFAEVSKGEKWGVIDVNGKEVVPIKFDHLTISGADLVMVEKYKRHPNGVVASRKFGFVDMGGKFVIDLEFDDADIFMDGLAVVAKRGKYGLIDKNGKVIIPLEYDAITNFKEGVAWVKKEGKQGFIDKNNNIVLPIIYDMAYHIQADIFAAQKDGKWGIVKRIDR